MILTITANPAIDKVYFVDSFVMGEVRRPIKMTATAGGKGLNVSRVAAILGEPVTAMGFLGGSAGQFIREKVCELGIVDAFTQIDGETRTCINIADESGRSGEILEPGPIVKKQDAERFLQQYKHNLEEAAIVCVSGSLPQGLDSEFYRELIRLANEKGKKIIVDTSGAVLRDVLEVEPFMVKPNPEELAFLLGSVPKTEEEIRQALLFMEQKGVKLPFVTMGKNGACALLDGTFYRFYPPTISAKNAVGSGDSTVAGIAVGLSRGMSVPDSLKLGMACGAANTQFDRTGMVTKELTEHFYHNIKEVIR